jgi:hypothetical protein
MEDQQQIPPKPEKPIKHGIRKNGEPKKHRQGVSVGGRSISQIERKIRRLENQIIAKQIKEQAEFLGRFNKTSKKDEILNKTCTQFRSGLKTALKELNPGETILIQHQFLISDENGVAREIRGTRRPVLKAHAEWRSSVFARDGWKCTECGSTKNLQAHHIKHFAKYPELATEISNGQTLCEACHGNKHPHLKFFNRNERRS